MQVKPCAKCQTAPRAANHSYCVECRNAYQRDYNKRRYASEPAYRESARGYVRKSLYGVDGAAFAAMMEAQGGACAICGGPPTDKRSLHVDHCHATGKVRALLCHKCNAGLGSFKDRTDLMQKAIEYVERFRA